MAVPWLAEFETVTSRGVDPKVVRQSVDLTGHFANPRTSPTVQLLIALADSCPVQTPDSNQDRAVVKLLCAASRHLSGDPHYWHIAAPWTPVSAEHRQPRVVPPGWVFPVAMTT
jgi:hypothetical protein